MPPLPVISGRACVDALRRLGYRELHQRGSHLRMVCEQRSPVTVPMHSEIARGTLRSIIRTTELTVDEFLVLLTNKG